MPVVGAVHRINSGHSENLDILGRDCRLREADLLGDRRLLRAWDERYRALEAAKSVSIY